MKKGDLLKNIFLVLLGVTLTFLVDYLTKSEKSMSYEIISKSEIFDLQSDSYLGIQVLVDTTKVKNINSSIIKFSNDGNIPIQKSEFESTINVFFSDSNTILRSDIITKSPIDLNPVINYSNNVLSIEPLLLNSNDEFTLRILSEGSNDSIFVSARIVGLTSINRIESNSEEVFSLFGKIWILIFSLISTLVYTSINTTIKFSPNLRGYRFINKEELAWIQLILFIISFLATLIFLKVIGIEEVWLQLLLMIVYLIIFNEIVGYFKKRGYKKIKDINIS